MQAQGQMHVGKVAQTGEGSPVPLGRDGHREERQSVPLGLIRHFDGVWHEVQVDVGVKEPHLLASSPASPQMTRPAIIWPMIGGM